MRFSARLLFALTLAAPLQAATTVTLLHFSDYHSHALPFYSEDRDDQGGIARAIDYLQREKRRGALVFSGGDMINKGSPAWSDKYRCIEWPWLNGLVDDMAFGNHDPDYGPAEFARCRAESKYPILSANTEGFQKYDVFVHNGVKIGVFAVAGPDFPALVKAAPFVYSDRIAAARAVVQTLREEEHVDAVVLIGHEHLDDDFALARAVPGIDVILGTHSHLKRDWMQIPGTETWFISPFQYLTYISRVELTFDHHRLTKARGTLVRMEPPLLSDAATKRKVAKLEAELERDPQYAPLFETIATLPKPMPIAELAHETLQTMRRVAHADVALSTASSFRQPLPAGRLTDEMLRAAMPYENDILVYELDGAALAKLVAYSTSRGGTDAVSFIAGAESIDATKTYRVAVTDFLAKVAPGYRELLAPFPVTKSGFKVREEVRKKFRATSNEQ
ncbi:MAG TPA: 5'-nucleotidase C-terminal domain-containing protein [Thermoanaerobaculia bacterium]|nr:5'-nucleotidase C-terminal domain-containing protein [Thermoanaerobaculia bacterium]